jgi:uncharacterized repeat protein (TIGR01451 family)
VVRRVLTITVLTATVLATAAFADAPLKGSMDVRKVVVQDGGREVFIPASEVNPADLIEYRLTYANDGELPLRNVSVVDPIPHGTRYVSMSATRPATGAVEFSIDGGKSYHAWPVRYKKVLEDGTEQWLEATPDMVSHIRWTIPGEFEPESEITFSYRATVK